MKQDPELFKKILEYVESKDSFPAVILPEELYSNIGGDQQKISYHAYLLFEGGFVFGFSPKGQLERFANIGISSTSDYEFGRIDGLTNLGNEFLSYSQSSNAWSKAINVITEQFGRVSINELFKYLAKTAFD